MNSRLTIDRSLDRGAFLGQLWALFGLPSPRAGGFEYILRDDKTGLDFIAYAGPRGACYGGELEQRSELRPVVEALEELLDHTRAINCAFEYRADIEVGGGTWVMGCTDGRSFDIPDRRNRRPSSPAIERRVRAR